MYIYQLHSIKVMSFLGLRAFVGTYVQFVMGQQVACEVLEHIRHLCTCYLVAELYY